MARLISYLRVHKTARAIWLGNRGTTGGVEAHAKMLGAKIEGEYMEVEKGRRTDRPELAKAVSRAKRTKATLVVAKLDRLSRNAGFLLALRDSGLPLIFCDMPGANQLTPHRV